MWNRGNFRGKTKSGIEARCKTQLEELGYANVYECKTFPYEYLEKRKYTPDFFVNGKMIEIKGYLDSADRKKMIKVRENYPDMFIGIVFSNKSKTISKSSKTTYEQWALKHGFAVAEYCIPIEWIRD